MSAEVEALIESALRWQWEAEKLNKHRDGRSGRDQITGAHGLTGGFCLYLTSTG